MGTRQNAHNDAEHDIDNEVSPCVSSRLAAMPPHVNLTDRSWPFVGSFAVHVLLVAILLSPMFQYPIVNISQTPAIFWFSTLSLPATSNGADLPLPGPSLAAAAQDEELHHQDPVRDDNPVPAHTPVTDTAPPAADSMSSELSVATPPVINAPRSDRQHAPLPAGTALPEAASVKKTTEPVKTEPAAKQAVTSQPIIATDDESQTSVDKLLPQYKAIPAVEQEQRAAEKLQQEKRLREQEQQLVRERLEHERIETEKARRKQLAREQEVQKRKNQEEIIRRQEAARTTSMRDSAALTTRQDKPSPQQNQKKPEPASPLKQVDKPNSARPPIIKPVAQQSPKSPESPVPQRQADKPVSISLPLIKGDIKLVIAGSRLPETTITFKEFAQTRRDRPFSLAESRRNTKIIPLTAHRDNTREVVIARASPGVYTVTVESAGEPAPVTLSLKLHEGTTRAVSRELGKHTIAGKKIIVKILMPEGILWDDDSSFSGNMQDSDGVTKFNTDTGLMWKEYTE